MDGYMEGWMDTYHINHLQHSKLNCTCGKSFCSTIVAAASCYLQRIVGNRDLWPAAATYPHIFIMHKEGWREPYQNSIVMIILHRQLSSKLNRAGLTVMGSAKDYLRLGPTRLPRHGVEEIV
jgi:hypothetical protein